MNIILAKEKVSMEMRIDKRIKDIDKTICDNIDLIDFKTVTRALIAQNLLAQSRNLVEHIAVKIYAQGSDIDVNWETINAAKEFLKKEQKYLFLRHFHGFLQESKSHYTPDDDGAERLVLKYYRYYLMIRNFMKKEYHMDILHNLKKFPIDTDKSIKEYQKKIAERAMIPRKERDYSRATRMYVRKALPFAVNESVFYELILTPAYDTTSKFDRFVCYSSVFVPSHYSIKADIISDSIIVQDNRMPIGILTQYEVSIRPCELNNYASILGEQINIKASHLEYRGLMSYLTVSGVSLLEIVESSNAEYNRIKEKIFGRSKTHIFEKVMDKSRALILSKKPGSNIIRYLLHTLNNKVIKCQRYFCANKQLSDLFLQLGCIPFDTMPFATSLLQHTPSGADLFGSICSDGREHELMARYIDANMNNNLKLYTTIEELNNYVNDPDCLRETFNSKLYSGHVGRRIERFGHNLYIRKAFDNTKNIIEALQKETGQGIRGYEDAINVWLKNAPQINSEEKKEILSKMFVKSHLSMIYGAAGTGKTYIINLISQFFDDKNKLYLANTNPAVENLRRKVNSQRCRFMTIKKFLSKKYINTEYDILIMDECSMVSNSDMARILEKVEYKILILAGDTYQIEPIDFGNWFFMAKYFIPRYAWNELEKPYRTTDSGLLDFWGKVRKLNTDLAECIEEHKYSSKLNDDIFKKQSQDEIILCLNYDGQYGINNINRFLQANNPNPSFQWGIWSFKVGDPVLFNETERFMPALYNNLKGEIVEISVTDEAIWFSVEIDRVLTELDMECLDLELLDARTPEKSVVRFKVNKKKESDEDNDVVNDTDIPFQIAYAVSIHKAQGLEYESVKIVITKEIDEMITHNIFYTAITRAKKYLKIYWSPETQEKVLSKLKLLDLKGDASIFAAQAKMKMRKI